VPVQDLRNKSNIRPGTFPAPTAGVRVIYYDPDVTEARSPSKRSDQGLPFGAALVRNLLSSGEDGELSSAGSGSARRRLAITDSDSMDEGLGFRGVSRLRDSPS